MRNAIQIRIAIITALLGCILTSAWDVGISGLYGVRDASNITMHGVGRYLALSALYIAPAIYLPVFLRAVLLIWSNHTRERLATIPSGLFKAELQIARSPLLIFFLVAQWEPLKAHIAPLPEELKWWYPTIMPNLTSTTGLLMTFFFWFTALSCTVWQFVIFTKVSGMSLRRAILPYTAGVLLSDTALRLLPLPGSWLAVVLMHGIISDRLRRTNSQTKPHIS
jgi:hypothetical protein